MIKPGQIVYVDIITSRIARITNMHPMVTPAELDNLTWYVYPWNMITEDMRSNMHYWEITLDRKFIKHTADITEEDKSRLVNHNAVADCLEQLSRFLGAMRYTKRKNAIGWDDLMPIYTDEIKEYRENGSIGPLIRSLADTEDDIAVAIAEFEIKHNTYLNFLITSEVYWNKWSKKIKTSQDPYATLLMIKNSVGIIK
jgi:hypothetical protein